MTTQYATFAGLPSGLTLTAKLFTEATPDTVAYTSDSTSNRTNAKDEYVFTFGETAAISGNYTLKVFSGTNIIGTGKRTFAGTDTETATETGVTAVLDSVLETAIGSAAADAATLVTRITSQRAANLDNLDVAISVVQSQITALNNLSAKANWFGSLLLEVPDSSTRAYVFELVVKDDEDKLVNLDGSPTIAIVNAAGTDRSSLITTGIANPSTGRYTLTVTVGTGTVNESLKLTASGTVSGEARYAVIAPQVVDYDNATQVALLLTRLGTPSVSVSADIAAVSTKLGTPAGASVSADIASIKIDTGTTIPGLFTTLTTKIRKFFQLSLRKDSAIATDNATELAEINANGGSGAGAYSNITEAQEAIRDRGDAAWTTGGGGGGDSSTLMLSTTIATVTSQTEFILTAGAPDNDVYNDQLVVITDAVTSTQKARMLVSDYVGSTKTLTLASAPGFEVAAGDSIAIIAVAGMTAAQNARLSLLGAGTRQTVKADSGASIELKIGDDYVAAINTAKRIEINDVDGSIYDAIRTSTHTARSFGFGYIKAGAKSSDVVTGTIDRSTVTYTAASGSVKAYTTVFVEMSVASTLAAGSGKYDVQVTHSNGKKQTLFTGDCELVTDYKS